MVPKGTDRVGIIRYAVIPAHSNFPFAYNSIPKGTRCAMNCLKMHFVFIFTASAEVFIRCATILLTRIFILRIIPFPKEPKPQRTAKKCISFPFLRHLQKFYTLPCDSARVNFHFAYNSVFKGTKDATNC